MSGWLAIQRTLAPASRRASAASDRPAAHRAYIPAALAYGNRGAGQLIGPQATLIFDIELLSIAPPQAQPAAKGTQP